MQQPRCLLGMVRWASLWRTGHGGAALSAICEWLVQGHDSLPGAQVYYGNPTCCAWSADGACVAAGGEDDLVTVFSVAEQCVVAWCEGHTSWVTAVRFDPWCVIPPASHFSTWTSCIDRRG